MNETTATVRVARYKEYKVVIDENATIDEVRANLAEIFPEIDNAEVDEDINGNLTFTVRAGTKG